MTVNYFGTGATLGVYIGFPNGVTDTSWTWTDVTADVVIDEPLRIQRGRSSERDTFQTGTCSFALLNTARKYDPEYSSSPYNGNLLPGRPVKIEITYSATTTMLFFGFIQGWPQAWERSDNKSIVNIVAHDAFKYLALARLPESRFWYEIMQDVPGTPSAWGWWRLAEPDSATDAADSSGNNYRATYSNGADGINSTTTEGLVEFGNNAARQQISASAPVAAGLPIYCAGLEFTVEAWVRFPDEFDPADFENAVIYQQTTPDNIDKRVLVQLVANSGLRSLNAQVYETVSSFVTVSHHFNTSALGRRHQVAFVRNGSSVDLYMDGANVFSSGGGTLSGSATSFGYLATIGGAGGASTGPAPLLIFDEVILWQDALASGRIAAHWEAGSTAGAGDTVNERITTALTDAGVTWLATALDSSSTTVRGADYQGGTSLLSYLQSLERTELGRLFVAANGTLTFLSRFHDNTSTVAAAFTDAAGGSLPYADAEYEFDDTRVVNEVTVSRTNGDPKRVTNAASVAEYGSRALSVDGLQADNDNTSQGMAEHLVARFKDPAARVRALTITPRANPAGLFPAVRDLEIGDKVTFRRLPLGTGSAYTKTLTVEGITHSIGVDGEWRTTYLTAPADPNTYLTLDSGTLGQLDQEELGF